jgi:peroxiredoxin Q/BCP
MSTLAEGDAAPDFTLPADAGADLSLAQFRGRKLAVLFFYPKDDTSGCTKEAIAFDALRNRFEAAGASVLGVSADSIASHQRFEAKHGLSLPLASDTDKQMLRRFGVWTKKRMYGREYEGIERTTVLIDQQGRIARIWRKVKVPGHAEDVLHAVEIS